MLHKHVQQYQAATRLFCCRPPIQGTTSWQSHRRWTEDEGYNDPWWDGWKCNSFILSLTLFTFNTKVSTRLWVIHHELIYLPSPLPWLTLPRKWSCWACGCRRQAPRVWEESKLYDNLFITIKKKRRHWHLQLAGLHLCFHLDRIGLLPKVQHQRLHHFHPSHGLVQVYLPVTEAPPPAPLCFMRNGRSRYVCTYIISHSSAREVEKYPK